MISRTSARFRRALESLPPRERLRARSAYHQFLRDAFHPSLQFKQVHTTRPVYSVRIGARYRALGIREGDRIIWFWIGSHAQYDRVLKSI